MKQDDLSEYLRAKEPAKAELAGMWRAAIGLQKVDGLTPMEDMDGIPLSEPRTPQMRFRAKLPAQVPPLSFVRHAVELSGR